MQLTLAAYYGAKPAPFVELVRSLQGRLAALLNGAFESYAIDQVHATVIALEARPEQGILCNANYREARGERRPMELKRVLSFLRHAADLPLEVRIGGYAREVPFPFTSRGLHPYQRSFGLQGPIAVAMGWPVKGEEHPMSLDLLRRSFQSCNVLHKYHAEPEDTDNDLYFVLGRVEREHLPEERLRGVEHALRAELAARAPLDLPVGRENLSVIAYSDTRLPPASSLAFGLDEADPERLAALYRA